jgi:hypothetical protein
VFDYSNLEIFIYISLVDVRGGGDHHEQQICVFGNIYLLRGHFYGYRFVLVQGVKVHWNMLREFML